MAQLHCGTCGSTDIRYNANAGEWGFPYRCFSCDPPSAQASAPPREERRDGFRLLLDRLGLRRTRYHEPEHVPVGLKGH